jgi:predicted RND superfamily exporter protein
MIPIAREVFWGPMAYAMIGGIIIATLLTLLFLPALYVAWYKIKEPTQEQREKAEAEKQKHKDEEGESGVEPAAQ